MIIYCIEHLGILFADRVCVLKTTPDSGKRTVLLIHILKFTYLGSSTLEVYITRMAPQNHADCVDSFCVVILSGHFRSLLPQFGLTPKSKRGLAASEAVDALGGRELRPALRSSLGYHQKSASLQGWMMKSTG